MQMKYWVITLVVVVATLFSSGVVQGQAGYVPEQAISTINSNPSMFAQLSSSQESIKFGYLIDSQPVSFYSRGASGYCGKLKKRLEDLHYKVDDVDIPYTNRFEQYGGIDIECSANTISTQREQKLEQIDGSFSKPFFTTSAKLLIRNSKRSLLNEPTPTFTVGVIGKTTTESVVSSIYPTAKIAPIFNRADALRRLKLDSSNLDSIDAYISDEILLASILEELQSDDQYKGQYTIEPKAYGLSRESYGVVVYNDQRLLAIVNDWIESEEGRRARKNDLERTANYNWMSKSLEFLLAKDYFYSLLLFLLIFLPLLFLLLFITHPLFVALIAKLPLFDRFLNWIRRREVKGKKTFIDPFIHRVLQNETFNVIVYRANKSFIPMFIDRETVVDLIEVIGQPLLPDNASEPSTVEIEKVAQNLAHEAKNNFHWIKVLETVKDAASDETEKWIRSAVTRAFEILKQSVDPGSSSS